MATRFLVVDDHPVVRQGLRRSIESQPDWIAVGEAVDGRDALRMVAEHRPDLIVMDIHLPDRDGLDVSREILREYPDTKIVVFSADADRARVDEALQMGVCGYLLKANRPARWTSWPLRWR